MLFKRLYRTSDEGPGAVDSSTIHLTKEFLGEAHFFSEIIEFLRMIC